VPLDTHEREVLADLIASVRSLAAQVLTLHLQLGAVRTILARKGTMSEAELSATLTELEAISSADEILSRDGPSVDEVFDSLLRRLDQAE
jgi:hypothetical protein